MRLYKIPFDIKHEEKVFGGYLSIRQALYLLLTILSAGILLIPIQKWIRVAVFLFFATIFLTFAFIKVNETRLDRYVVNIIVYIFRKKKFKFER